MAINLNWTCPYCNRDSTITNVNLSRQIHYFDYGHDMGKNGLFTQIIVCPNVDCNKSTITASLHVAYFKNRERINEEHIMEWNLKPASLAKQFPSYIPKAIIDDYQEACIIKDLSPKASATLSRRCLQGMIRDFWKVKKGRLVDEIKAIEDKVDPITWQAIIAVKNIGNIGAHMEKDINLIIDVDPQEAQLLIGLIEMLIKDWYVSQHEREEQLKSLIGVAATKKEEKKSKVEKVS